MNWCTWFPEGWWGYCCELHDKAYDAQVIKEVADQALFSCVANSSPTMVAISTVIGTVMYVGVRVFGKKYYANAGKDKA